MAIDRDDLVRAAVHRAADDFLDEIYSLTKVRHERQAALGFFVYLVMMDRSVLRANGTEDAEFRQMIEGAVRMGMIHDRRKKIDAGFTRGGFSSDAGFIPET